MLNRGRLPGALLAVALLAGCSGGSDPTPPPPPPTPAQVVTAALANAKQLSRSSFRVKVVTDQGLDAHWIVWADGGLDVTIGILTFDYRFMGPGTASRSERLVVSGARYVRPAGKKERWHRYTGWPYDKQSTVTEYGRIDPVELLVLAAQAAPTMRPGRADIVEFADGSAVLCSTYQGTADYRRKVTFPGSVVRTAGELTDRLKRTKAKRPDVSICIDDHGLPRLLTVRVRAEGKTRQIRLELTDWGRKVDFDVPTVG